MRIVYEYSHLGGSEILRVRYPEIDRAISDVIMAIKGDFKTKISEEKGSKFGKLLYAPKEINKAFKREFAARGFKELKRPVEVNVPGYVHLKAKGYKQIDFSAGRVLIEVQLGKYFAMFYDMAKLEHFYRHDLADVGVEIVPSHLLQREMSSGIGRGEMLVVDIIGLQRSFPTFPVKIILVQPEEMEVPTTLEIEVDR